MKATIEPPEERIVTVTMTEADARALHASIGATSVYSRRGAGMSDAGSDVAHKLFWELDNALD